MPMVYTAVFLLRLRYHLQYKITEVYMTDLKASLAKGHRIGFLQLHYIGLEDTLFYMSFDNSSICIGMRLVPLVVAEPAYIFPLKTFGTI